MRTEFETVVDESSGEEDAEGNLTEEHAEQENGLHQEEGNDEEETADSQEDVEDADFEEVPAMRLKTDKQKIDVDFAEDEDEEDDAYDDDEDVTDHEENYLMKPLAVPPKNIAPSKMIKAKTAKAATETKPTRPSTQQMVDTAIKTLDDRTGSSVQAIRSFIVANYPQVDSEKIRVYIKKYLRTAVLSGKLIQTKGTGATGSFKLSAKAEKNKAMQKAKKAQKAKQDQKEKKKVKAKILVKPQQQQKKEDVRGKNAAMGVKTAAAKETKAKPATKQPKPNVDAVPSALPTAELKAKKTNKEPIKKHDEAMATKDAVTAKKSKLSPTADQLTNGKGAKAEAVKSKKPNLQRKNLNISISKQPPRPKTAAKGKAALVPASKSPAQGSKKGATKKFVAEATNDNIKSKEIRVETAAPPPPPPAAAATAATKPSSKAKKK